MYDPTMRPTASNGFALWLLMLGFAGWLGCGSSQSTVKEPAPASVCGDAVVAKEREKLAEMESAVVALRAKRGELAALA